MGSSVILYNNIIEDSTITLSGTATEPGYDTANIIDYRPYTWWIGTTTTDPQYIQFDYGSSVAVDSFAIRGHNLSTIGATISVEYADDSGYSSNLAAVTFLEESATTFSPTTDYAFMKTFASATKRYWRLKISGSQTDVAKIAVMFLGPKLSFSARPQGPFSPRTISVKSQSNFSQTGQFLGSTIKYKPFTITPVWRQLTWVFVNGVFKTFWNDHASLYKPFFWAVDLDQYPDDVYFVKMQDSETYNTPIQLFTKVNTLSLRMEGIVE